jgi:hypothetical protein
MVLTRAGRHHGGVLTERPWDEEAAGMPDPLANLRHRGFSPYGPEGEILGVGQFAGGVRRATGWRRAVGILVAALLLASFAGSAVVSVIQLVGGNDASGHARTTVGSHLP